MAFDSGIYHGRTGVVYAGAIGSDAKIGYTQAWTVAEAVEEADITAMGDTVRTYRAGLRDSNVSIDAIFNAGDTGQGSLNTAFTAGSTVVVTLYFTGSTTDTDSDNTPDDDHITGTLTVLTREISAAVDDMVRVKFTARGTMTITEGDGV